jgi:hypothetical protein
VQEGYLRKDFGPNSRFKNIGSCKASVSDQEPDPDLHGSALIFVGWIRMRIRIGNTIPDPNSGGKK